MAPPFFDQTTSMDPTSAQTVYSSTRAFQRALICLLALSTSGAMRFLMKPQRSPNEVPTKPQRSRFKSWRARMAQNETTAASQASHWPGRFQRAIGRRIWASIGEVVPFIGFLAPAIRASAWENSMPSILDRLVVVRWIIPRLVLGRL